jgi:hypothetical protein
MQERLVTVAAPDEREVGDSSQRDSRERRSGHKTLLYLAAPAPGVLRAGAGAVFAPVYITALVAGAGSILHDRT